MAPGRATTSSTPWSYTVTGQSLVNAYSLYCRSDILVVAEEIRRVVPVLQIYEPIIIRSEGRLDAIGPFFGLQANVVDVVTAAGEWAHRLGHFPRPADVGCVLRWIKPNRIAAPFAQCFAMAERGLCRTNPIRRVPQLLEIYH